MKLVPIENTEAGNTQFQDFPDCLPVIGAMSDYYKKIGYNFPWVGYFALDDNQIPVGTGGFKGAPKDRKVEIAYYTFKQNEGKGIGTSICKGLVGIAQKVDSSVLITARTLPVDSSSCSILKKNGFTNRGIVIDQEDGNVFEWVLENPNQH